MLTVMKNAAPESLSAFQAVVLAHAKTGLRPGWDHVPRQARLQSLLRAPLPPKPESDPHYWSHLADPIRAKAISRPFKSHRQITASLAPAYLLQSKLPGRNNGAQSCLVCWAVPIGI